MELPILVLQDTLNQQREQLSQAEKDLNKAPKFKEFREKGINNLKGFIAELEEGINVLTLANKQKEAFYIQRVTNSFDLAKANQTIELIKNAECESDVLAAVALKDELNWFAVTDDIKDLWNECYGDAKKYLP
tara:strand:- start:256 stop:654 length:399 start_codon:yes stop_codon:yes gene_type:complete